MKSEVGERKQVWIDGKLHKQLKIISAMTGIDMQFLLDKAIVSFLKKKEYAVKLDGS